MDIQAEKYLLIEYIMGIKDAGTISKLKALIGSSEKDWWDELSSTEKAEIQEGIRQADNGELISHEEVMANPRKWA
jgi:hypothetical protein